MWGGLIIREKRRLPTPDGDGTYPAWKVLPQYEPTSMATFGQHDSFPDDIPVNMNISQCVTAARAGPQFRNNVFPLPELSRNNGRPC